MSLGTRITWTILLVAVVCAQLYLAATASAQQDIRGPAADTLIFRGLGSQDIADREIKAGRIDLFLFNLKTELARKLRDDPSIRLVEAPATMYSLVFNPAPAPEGQLNPFSIREVRWAMQFIINREEIASVIFRGLAVPMYVFVSPFDLDYVTVFEDVKSLGVRYDPDYSRQLVSDAMKRAGAVLENGVWKYGGKEVTIRLIYRVEDERRDIGEMLRNELERLGFKVESILLEFGPAVERVYSRDPASFEWHIYTEGWGRGGAARYEAGSINQFCAPWTGNMPGWREVGFWQYENPRLDELGKKLFKGEYRSKEERDELFREMTRICTEESVRIWIATGISVFPVTPNVKPLVTDIVGGLRSVYTLREALNTERSEKTLIVGHLWVEPPGGRSAWNPIGGFGDVYSSDIFRNIFDPPITRHPISGKPVPFRAGFKVEASSPEASVPVPSDAFVWNHQAGRWTRVGPGVLAKSKIVYDFSQYLGARWHHGQPITWGDVLYSIYQAFDLAYNERKSKIETAIAVTSRPYLETFKGFRIIDGTKLEVYVDYWHFEPEVVAEYALPTSVVMPWEILCAMDVLVFDRRQAAYSDTAAARFNPEFGWVNLVKERTSRQVAETVLRDLLQSRTYPLDALTVEGVYSTSWEEAEARYRSSIDWFRRYGHLVVSQGPFMLRRFDGPSQTAELVAYRDASYPFGPGRWGELANPLGYTLKVTVPREALLKPDTTVPVGIGAPSGTKVRYVLMDPASGEVVSRGDAQLTAESVFEIRITPDLVSRMAPGLYRLYAVAYSPESVGIVLEVEAGIRFTREAPAQTTQTRTQETGATTTPRREAEAFLAGLLLPVAALLAIGAIVAVVLFLLRRRDR
jgi:peptide/nickel transport system substrate-binding protein